MEEEKINNNGNNENNKNNESSEYTNDINDVGDINDVEEIRKYERAVLLRSPELKQRIIKLREENSGITYTSLANKLSKEFDSAITPIMVRNVEKGELTMELTREVSIDKPLAPFLKSIERRFANLEKTTDKYHDIVERTVDRLSELDDVELIKNIKDVLGVGKQVETTSRMLLAQIDLVKSETDKLKITATHGMVKVDDAVKDVDKYFVDLLKVLEAQDKIKIIDSRILRTKSITEVKNL